MSQSVGEANPSHHSPHQPHIDKADTSNKLGDASDEAEATTFAVTTGATETLFRDELESSPNLPTYRIVALQSALSLVAKFAQTALRTHHVPHEPVLPGNVTVPERVPSEVFFLLLNRERRHRNMFHWPDHISVNTIERMCTALGEGAISMRREIEYKICVYSEAFAYINRWLRFCAPGPMTMTFQQSLDLYAAACLRHLKELDLVSPPTLATLQALLSGAGLVSLLGNTSQAWSLTALASRLAINLHFHTLTHETLKGAEHAEVCHFVYWCYYMDKTLSMILVRPSSLPDLKLDPACLVSTSDESPLSHKVEIMVRLAQVQDLILPLLTRTSSATSTEVCELVERLEGKLYDIQKMIDKLSPSWTTTPELRIELDSIYFVYYSIFTTLLRLHPILLHDPQKRQKCLQYARNALVVMGQLRGYVESPTNTSTDYLSWSIILYPLTPFYIVFCNVVATSNTDDIALLQAVTDLMGLISERCVTGRSLHELFRQFVDLCVHLGSTHEGAPIQHNAAPGGEHQGLESQKVTATSPRSFTDVSPTLPTSYVTQTASVESGSLEPGVSHDTSVWDDSLMLQLLNARPTIDWFEPVVSNTLI